MKFNSIYIIFLFHALLNSCTQDFKDTTYNLLGGASRTSSYEEYGQFPIQILTNERLNILDTTGIIQPPIAFGPQDYLIATKGGSIIRLADTRSVWEYKLDSGEVAFTSLAGIISNGKSAFITNIGNFISLDSDGKLLYKRSLHSGHKNSFLTFSEILALDDGFIIGTNEGKIVKFDTSGNIQKELSFPQSISKIVSSAGNTVVFALSHNLFGRADTLIVADRNLNLQQTIGIENFRILAGPAIYNGKIYVGGSTETSAGRLGRIVSFDLSGNKIYDIETDMVIRNISVDISENLYASGFNSGVAEYYSGLYSYDVHGTERWKLYLKSSVISPLKICKKYVIFAGLTIEGAGIFSLRKNDGTLVKLNALNEMPLLYLHPAVTTEPLLVFFGSEKPNIVKLTQTQLDKILPW